MINLKRGYQKLLKNKKGHKKRKARKAKRSWKMKWKRPCKRKGRKKFLLREANQPGWL